MTTMARRPRSRCARISRIQRRRWIPKWIRSPMKLSVAFRMSPLRPLLANSMVAGPPCRRRPAPPGGVPPSCQGRDRFPRSATNEAELERLRAELDRYQGELQRAELKAAGLQAELAEAQGQINRVHQEADAEVDRMQRDLHELKSRASLLPK